MTHDGHADTYHGHGDQDALPEHDNPGDYSDDGALPDDEWDDDDEFDKLAAEELLEADDSHLAPVRDVLAEASDVATLHEAIKQEVHRISNRDVSIDLSQVGDLQMAREFGEGVLRGLEFAPDARLVGLRVGEAGNFRSDDVFAHTVMMMNGFMIEINPDDWLYGFDAFREEMREARVHGHCVTACPAGVVLHEMGHVWASRQGSLDACERAIRRWRHQNGETGTIKDVVERHISGRAAKTRDDAPTGSLREAPAEAFADVLLHSETASTLSTAIVDEIARAHAARQRPAQE